MVSAQVINDVNRTLYKILRESFGEDDKDVQIIFGSPAEEDLADKTKAGIFVFLYNMLENPYTRNEPNEISGGNNLSSVRSPLGISLYYMLTPFSASVEGKDTLLDNVRSHTLLTKAVRAFYDNGLINTRYFPPDTVLGEVRVTLTPSHMNLEEITKIWTTFSKPFQLSVSYEVSTIWIRSEEVPKEIHLIERQVLEERPVFSGKEMSKLKTGGGNIVKISPDHSGDLEDVRPTSVQPGMGLSIFGKNFQRKKWIVKIDDMEIDSSNIRIINENLIRIKTPSDMLPGIRKLSLKSDADDLELSATFQALPTEPTPIKITEIKPNQAKVGDIVSLYGINFAKDARITIGTADVLAQTFVDNSQINMMVPDGITPGVKMLTVRKTSSDSHSLPFKILPG